MGIFPQIAMENSKQKNETIHILVIHHFWKLSPPFFSAPLNSHLLSSRNRNDHRLCSYEYNNNLASPWTIRLPSLGRTLEAEFSREKDGKLFIIRSVGETNMGMLGWWFTYLY